MEGELLIKIALIGILGVGAQWIAWRTGRPAIVFLLAAGIIAGPVLQIFDPEAVFGDLRQPIIKLAVAVILFEGGLSLNLRDLSHAGSAVRRMILLGVPLGWIFCSMAVHYGTGLAWPISLLFGGILVVTGPTVIGPMLREINVPRRVGDTLKWEATINDPIGSLLAIIIYATITFEGSPFVQTGLVLGVLMASVVAGLLGLGLGLALTWAFPRGLVPEYLKAPVLLVAVISGFVVADTLQHESGLITVTVMGMVMANRPTFSMVALRRFKEDLSVLLISGVFVILSATLNWQVLERLQVEFLLFLFLLMFIARPLTVFISLLGSDMPWRERAFIAWIAPRGIVAVAITGLFALRLTELDVEGADALVPLAFTTAIVTIAAHGFSASAFARLLGIDRGPGNALMLIGVNQWSLALAEAMTKLGIRVVMTDSSKFASRMARKKELETHQGDMLDDEFRHNFDWLEFSQVAAVSDSDAYNALVCSELGPERGFSRVLQVAPDSQGGMTVPRGGTLFSDPVTIYDLQTHFAEGWRFSTTKLTEQFDFEQFIDRLWPGAAPLAVVREDGSYELFSSLRTPQAREGDTVVSFVPPESATERLAKRAAKPDRGK